MTLCAFLWQREAKSGNQCAAACIRVLLACSAEGTAELSGITPIEASPRLYSQPLFSVQMLEMLYAA